MRNSKAAIGSLSNMVTKVRQEKKNGASSKPSMQKTLKSAETVQDSSSDSDTSSSGSSSDDDDSDAKLDGARAAYLKKSAKRKANGTNPVAATPAKPTSNGKNQSSARKPVKESKSESDSESETSSSETSSAVNKATSKPVATQAKAGTRKAGNDSDSSSESTSSSGSSSDSETEEAPKVAAQAQAKGAADDEESESSSEDEDMPDADAQVNEKGAGKGAAANGQDTPSEESDSSSESDNEGDDVNNATVASGKDATKSASQLSAAPWLNSSDFTIRKASSDNPGQEVSDFLSSANLEGKQVWYFTAPASLPITVLKDMEIDLAKATQGGALLTHRGDDYGLDLEAHATTTQIQLLIPSKGGDKYTSLNRGIDSTVHLRRMAKFGPGGEASAKATDDYVPKPKPVREQPEGLRARYTPIGVPTPIPLPSPITASQTKGQVQPASASANKSDVEMTSPLPTTTPASKAKSSKLNSKKERKRKHATEEDASAPTEAQTSTPKEQPAKRLKAQEANAKKQTPVQPPVIAAISSSATSVKETPKKTKQKKDNGKKDQTPKPMATPSSTPITAIKQTPVPLPTIPGMKR
ncbi:hypothetical protein F5Y17DRAFT_450388 [Xylariaceae sp. FL0594]|nr:hypothetical protein F5Y17DRAFT_450388 [Xylariaceae sp. FL0594]